MAIILGEDIASSQEDLLDVFCDGYANNYIGNERFLRNYIIPAQVAVLDDRDQSLNAAALMRNSRITAVSTRTNREKYGSRFKSLVGILQFANLVDQDAWIGIGINVKESVKDAAKQSGMSRSYDESLLEKRLVISGRADDYSVHQSVSGLLISLADSSHGPGYWQEVWDWSEE